MTRKLEELKELVNITKLNRDYSNNPLNVSNGGISTESLSKEELEYLYIELNLSRKEIALYCGCSERKIKRNLLKYHLHKEPINYIENTKHTLNSKIQVDYPLQSEEIKNNMTKTVQKKYGVNNVFQLECVKEKAKKTNLERYGNELYSQSNDFKQLFTPEFIQKKLDKEYQTKKKNHSFNSSKPEETIYNLLCSKYQQVERQYSSELYPWKCDFYIPDLDLYIEYQGHWTHGKEPFDSNNPYHIKLLEKMSTSRKFIQTWTKSDVLKRETARKNNLNYLEFFNMNEFMIWFNKKG